MDQTTFPPKKNGHKREGNERERKGREGNGREGREGSKEGSNHVKDAPNQGTSCLCDEFFSDMFEAYFGGQLDPLKLPKDDEDSFAAFC